MNLITVQKLAFGYGEKALFSDVSFTLKAGEKALIRMPSGSGKSTLLKLLLGFEEPWKGEIVLEGQAISPHTIAEYRSKIAYVAQSLAFPNTRCKDFLHTVFAYKQNRAKKLEDESFSKLAVEGFKLPADILSRNIAKLSGGESSRLALAIALTLDRPLLLLDEPTAALNAELSAYIATLICSLNKTVLIVSHDSFWTDSSLNAIREICF